MVFFTRTAFWNGVKSFDAGKEIADIVEHPQFNFAKDISGGQSAAQETMARYDFIDGFASAAYGSKFTDSYVSGKQWDAVINSHAANDNNIFREQPQKLFQLAVGAGM